MTSPAATVNITYDGTDVTDLTGIFLHSVVRGGPGTTPQVSGRDDQVPGTSGVFVRNRQARTRTIELRGWVRGVASSEATDRDDYWANRTTLEALFDPTDTATLSIDTGTETYTITARPIPTPEYDEAAPSFAYVSIVLESTVPDWTTAS